METYTDYKRVVEWIRRIRRVVKEALIEYEVLDDKVWELDAELSHLYYSLHSLYGSIKRALEEGRIAKARELLREAERKAEKFRKLISEVACGRDPPRVVAASWAIGSLYVGEVPHHGFAVTVSTQ